MHPLVLDASSSWWVYVFPSRAILFCGWVGGERKLSAPAVGVQFSLVPLSFPWGAGLGPSAVLTLEQRVEAEWFDFPTNEGPGVSLTERFPLPPSSLLGQAVHAAR